MSTYKERMSEWFKAYEKYETFEWDEGEEHCIYDGEGLASGKTRHKNPDDDFPDWFRNWGNHFGERAYINGEYRGILIGMSYTYLDYYYIIQDDNSTVHYVTCVSKLETKK